MNQTFTPRQLRLKMTEKIWLYYFNDILWEKGLISRDERQKMKLRIDAEYENFLHEPAFPYLSGGAECAAVLK